MRIHSTRNRARDLYDGHRHPFFRKVVKGWHARPGKETVAMVDPNNNAITFSLAVRAQFQPHDNRQAPNNLDATTRVRSTCGR
jgi:hypothetical protein